MPSFIMIRRCFDFDERFRHALPAESRGQKLAYQVVPERRPVTASRQRTIKEPLAAAYLQAIPDGDIIRLDLAVFRDGKLPPGDWPAQPTRGKVDKPGGKEILGLDRRVPQIEEAVGNVKLAAAPFTAPLAQR